jgi:hypothetical protein
MQIDRDGTIRFDLHDEMLHVYRVAKGAHSKGTIRDDKGCLLPDIARWIEATGGPSESLTLVQATVLFPLAVFRAMTEHFLDAREAEDRRKARPYMDNG